MSRLSVCADCGEKFSLDDEGTMCGHNSIIIHNEDGETICLQCGEEGV